MPAGAALGLLLALAAEPSAIAPRVTADLDGDGTAETVSAIPAGRAVRLEVRGPNGRKRAEAKASAPAGDVVPVTLTTAPLGSVGALVEVVAATDATECRTIFRFRDGALARLPLRNAAGRELPECGPAGVWSYAWDRLEGRPAEYVRVRTDASADGRVVTREAYAFAGFSLDYDAAGSGAEVGGVPIPSWYRATLYTRPALERLYNRFGLDALRAQPTLRIDADPARGVFALRFTGPDGELVAPVDAFAETEGQVRLGARAGERTAHVDVRLQGDARVPFEVRVSGLGAPWDQIYGPAGSWRGGARRVYPDASDELAAEFLAGLWTDGSGKTHRITVEGEPPYRLRWDGTAYGVDLRRAAAPLDLVLEPAEPAGRPQGVILRGSNSLEIVPAACADAAAAPGCRRAGDGKVLRRMGARVNVR